MLVAAPLAPFGVSLARPVFVGVSNALLAYAVTRNNRRRLLIFTSFSWVTTLFFAQWEPLLMAAVLTPGLLCLLVAKPTVGFALATGWPSRRLVVGILLVGLSFVLRPTWLIEWLAVIRGATHFVPLIFTPIGFPLILAALRWRRPEARLLLALAVLPQTPHLYATFPLFLIPATTKELATLSVLSYLAHIVIKTGFQPTTYEAYFAAVPYAIIPLLYLPCLLMVLRRPNQGEVPEWLERKVFWARIQLLPRRHG